MNEEFEKISAEIQEKLSRGENTDYEMNRLNEAMNQKIKETNEIIQKEAYRQVIHGLHKMAEEFIKKENHTMEEYNEVLRWFDDTREKVDVEGHFYFEEIYFILNVNVLTPLITIKDINTIIVLYEKFMNKAIETVASNEEKEQLKKIYNEDSKNIKMAIEDRRNNYPTAHEAITKKQCLNCLRSIELDSETCMYCGNMQ